MLVLARYARWALLSKARKIKHLNKYECKRYTDLNTHYKTLICPEAEGYQELCSQPVSENCQILFKVPAKKKRKRTSVSKEL